MSAELGQSRCVRGVGLSPGQILYLPGVDEHDFNRAVLQDEIEWFPVVPRGHHHNQRHFFGNEMIMKRPDLVGHGPPWRPSNWISIDSDLGLRPDFGILLPDIGASAPSVDDVHAFSFDVE